MNFLNLITYYIFFLFSIVGYGLFFIKFFRLKLEKNELALSGIFGSIFLVLISFTTNIFLAHGFIHNIFLHTLGIFLFSIYYKDFFPKKFIKRKYLYGLFIFIILFFTLNLMGKTHDDFGWYHLPYTLNLSQQKLQFGLGHFNHGFKTHSSIFYLNSLFYLPYIKFYSFNFGQQFISLFSILFFFQKIFQNESKLDSIKLYSVLSLLFTLIVFYRLAEHGTDRSGQILIFVLVILIMEFLNDKNNYKKITLILIILSFVVTLKSYFIIFGILILPIIFNKKFSYNIFRSIIFSNTFCFIIILLILNFGAQMTNTGCLLYPINFTCFDNFIWSFNSKYINDMNTHYELWSKSGANPNWRVENIQEYLAGLNWIDNWIKSYFFNKVLDFVAGLCAITLITYLFIRKNLYLNHKINMNYFIIFIIFIILLSIWFSKFPQLRYGGFVIVSNIFFLLFCFFTSKFSLKKKITKPFKILIMVGLLIFTGRNIDRIIDEKRIYDYDILTSAFYKIGKYDYDKKIFDNGLFLNINTKGSCWDIGQPCTHRSGVKMKKWKNYIVYYE